jgi:YggT family protein
VFALGNLLIALADVLDVLFKSLEIIIVVRVVLSWANADNYNQFVRIVVLITEPFLSPFRKLLPPWKMSGLDLSPACALLSLYFIRLFLIPTLFDLANKLHG